jgi:Predicted DNA-binding protein containing a Zn-ribbon domain
MALFRDADKLDYVVAVKCPWCGQRTTKFAGKLKDSVSDCEKCGTRFYNSSTICYVPKDKVDMVDKNRDEPLIK